MSSDVHALSGAYAVDALDEAERIEFERHLATCAACQTEVDSLTEAAASLAALTSATPPPSLRDAVLADIATVRPLAPVVTPLRAVSAPAARRRPFLLAAAAAAVVAVGAVATHPWQSAPTTSLAQRVIHASDVSSTSERVGAATVTVYRSAALGRAVVVTEKMPAAPSGRVYELWLQDLQGAMHPAGLMPHQSSATVLVRGASSNARGVGITVEPAGGSQVPTSSPIAVVGFA